MRLLGFLPLLVATAVLAQEPAPDKHLVVFNRPGPAWDTRAGHPEAVQAHVELYRSYAESGAIVAGGRFDGEPVLGMSIFSQDSDQAAIESAFRADPAVKLGIVALEFRTLQIQMGGLE